MNKHQAIHKFWSGFGIPAYVASAVPAQAEFPYLTYEAVDGALMDGEVPAAVNVWYYSDTESAPNQKVFEIASVIGFGGVTVPCDDGTIWIKRGNPWCQSMRGDPNNDKVKRRYINLVFEFLTTR